MPSEQSPEAGAAPRMDVGLYPRPEPEPVFGPTEMIAGGVSLVWLVLVGGFFLFAGTGDGSGGALGAIMTLVAIFMPIALIWIAAITLRTARAMRAEAQRLQATVDAMRHAYINQAQSAGMARPSMERRLEEIAAATRQAENAIATFTSRRDGDAAQQAAGRKAALSVPKPDTPGEEQPTLALGTPAEVLGNPVSVADFTKAMNFPDSPDDKEGFRALRRALDDRGIAKLIRAAQDVLTLLSQDGIYMDDLKPDRARPDIWRRFAQGERGRAIASLGGVRDRSSLALTASRMRQDTIFRDAAHHFLRQFDRTFAEFEANATDAEIVALAETRTARAFMLLGRVTGIFD